MHQKKQNNKSHMRGYNVYRVCLLGIMCLVLAVLEMVAGLAPAAYASGPGGNVSDPVVKAVDIAKPAVVRILTQVVGHLTVAFPNSKGVTFPQTPQQGVNGYPLTSSGTGAFISSHGDVLTADHVINPVQDDKQALDQFLDQEAAPDVAAYINQHFQQKVTADQVAQELVSGQLPSNTQYDKAISRVFLSTDYSGPLNAGSLQTLPAGQFADVDQIKASSPFTVFDTAIIHVNGMNNMPMLQLGDSSTVQEQDQLRIIGFPGNGDVNDRPNDLLTSSINIINVSSIKTLPGGGPLIQVGGNVEHGDSGGPALDSNGHVVGIVSFGADTGSTSFLRASSSAKQLMQQAGIDTAPSALQASWSKAFNDYASNNAGHWHLAASEFQQLSGQFPQFKAVAPFLQYANQQAQSENPATGSGTPSANPVANVTGGQNFVFVIIGAIVVLGIIVISGGVIVARRRGRKAGVATAPQMGYGPAPAAPYFGAPNQQMPGTLPTTPFGQPGQPVPQTPTYPGQAAYPQVARPPVPASQPAYSPSPTPQSAYAPSSASQPAHSSIPQSAHAQSSAPQPAFRTQHFAPPAPVASGMAAFGAPPAPGAVPATPADSDATIIARSGSSSSPQWRTWSCGHTNRFDASFCGTCGESARPAPIVRRVEQ